MSSRSLMHGCQWQMRRSCVALSLLQRFAGAEPAFLRGREFLHYSYLFIEQHAQLFFLRGLINCRRGQLLFESRFFGFQRRYRLFPVFHFALQRLQTLAALGVVAPFAFPRFGAVVGGGTLIVARADVVLLFVFVLVVVVFFVVCFGAAFGV